jgi:hypothetical protein
MLIARVKYVSGAAASPVSTAARSSAVAPQFMNHGCRRGREHNALNDEHDGGQERVSNDTHPTGQDSVPHGASSSVVMHGVPVRAAPCSRSMPGATAACRTEVGSPVA